MQKILVLCYLPFNSEDHPEDRFNTNKPLERCKCILDELPKDDIYDIINPKFVLTKEMLKGLNVHNSNYLDFLEGCYKSWKVEPDYDVYRNGCLIPYHFSRRKLFQSHLSLPFWKQMGFYCDDVITPISHNTWRYALESANNCYVVSDYLDKYQVIYCLNTYPGHHAMFDGYGGYCYLNNAAVCAKRLHPLRISILDLDYHHGNGTQDIFEDSSNVCTISIHADPSKDYPSFSGYVAENTDNNLNLIFPKKCNLESYLGLVKVAMEKVRGFESDVLIIPLGLDTLSTDPDASRLYGCGLEVKDFRVIGRSIKEQFKGKIVVTQEGGYDLNLVPGAVDGFLRGLMDL